jgi:formylglycine-generating enzyme required for sulfatase activity
MPTLARYLNVVGTEQPSQAAGEPEMAAVLVTVDPPPVPKETPPPTPVRTKTDAPIAFDWVTIPAGEFLMGSDKQKDSMADNNETPQHRIYLPEYHIARLPVTNAQYLAFVTATGHKSPDRWANGRIPDGKENHPVVNVFWHDAQAFCKWAGVRLPSEAEWEKAARGTDGLIWPWGNESPNNKLCNFNSNVGDTTPVGKYPDGASPYGCLDMAGNVWEWTSTVYKKYPYDARDGREDPDADGNRVLRGGSFGGGRRLVRCACRGWLGPDFRVLDLGFRVVSPGL